MGAQKNRLIETVLLNSHNICFWLRNKKINFWLRTLIWRPGIVDWSEKTCFQIIALEESTLEGWVGWCTSVNDFCVSGMTAQWGGLLTQIGTDKLSKFFDTVNVLKLQTLFCCHGWNSQIAFQKTLIRLLLQRSLIWFWAVCLGPFGRQLVFEIFEHLIPARSHWSWNNFYSHSPPFCCIIEEGLLSVTSESMCTKYWLTACSRLPRKKCG